MSRPLALLLVLFASLTGLPPAAAAGRGPMVVAPFEVTAVDAEHGQAATAVLVMYLRDARVDVRDLPAGTPPPTSDAAIRQAAIAAGVPQFVRGQLTALGNKAIVSVQLFDAAGPAPVWTGRLTANTPEDLETCLGRRTPLWARYSFF
jgi:hypothetical protein